MTHDLQSTWRVCADTPGTSLSREFYATRDAACDVLETWLMVHTPDHLLAEVCEQNRLHGPHIACEWLYKQTDGECVVQLDVRDDESCEWIGTTAQMLGVVQRNG
jgi:hypothetical protein